MPTLCTSALCLHWQLPSTSPPPPPSLSVGLPLPPSLHHSLRQSALLPPVEPLSPRRRSFAASKRRSHAFVCCEVVVEVDGALPSAEDQKSSEPAIGSKVRVIGPLKVFHVPKNPDFDLGGCEGELKEVLKIWKGKHISANFPYKVQFVLDLGGKQVKFFAHLKENEFEVIS